MGSIGTMANGAQANGNGESAYKYGDNLLLEPRPIRAIIIGAGLSGIAATKLFKERQQDVPIQFQIYEKNHDVCGTWLENRYPG